MSSEPLPYHKPVLLEETLSLLELKPGDCALDATLGGGGHSEAMLKAVQPYGTLVALDRDTDAIAEASKRLEPLVNKARLLLLHTPFGAMEEALRSNDATHDLRFDGIVFDLGVSSHQLDTERGFSFRRDEPLDMRMDTTANTPTAADILAEYSEEQLAHILWEYGEERWSRRIAQRIVAERNQSGAIRTTGQLVKIIEDSIPRAKWPKEIHVATRGFMGLRIVVNNEIAELQKGLSSAFHRLQSGGVLAVMSYHSLEDRIVKQMFAEWTGRTPSPSGMSLAALQPDQNLQPAATALTRKPLTATEAETKVNPRARSAKLRAIRLNG